MTAPLYVWYRGAFVAIGINADMAESISDILNVSVSRPYPVQGQ